MFCLIVLVAAAVATAQGACLGGCYYPTTHYEEVGCSPEYEVGLTSCCPNHYDCYEFFGQKSDKCYFQGKVYNHGEQIASNLTEQYCSDNCFCSKGDLVEITCANIECAEHLNPPQLQSPDCFLAHDLDGCCSRKTVCPPFNKLATCEVKGKIYYEGQRFPGPIYRGREYTDLNCVCQPNFKGKFVEPFCKKISCGTELRDTAHFRKRCAPVYFGTHLDCPIHWECPQKEEKIVPNIHGSTTAQKCYFGKQQLNIGDKLILDRSEHSPIINCECQIPPLVTCSQQASN